MLRRLLQTLYAPAPDWRAAKATYGPEPRRMPAEVSRAERVTAVLDGYITGLLDEVQGRAARQQQSPEAREAAFRALLPTTWQDVLDHVAEHRLPRPYATYEEPAEGQVGRFLVQRDGVWHLLDSERGTPWDVAHGSHADVTAAALAPYRAGLARFLVP